MFGLDDVVLQVSVESALVELIEIGRIEDRHVDIAGAEQVVDQHLFAVPAKFVERPHLLGRAQAAVKGGKHLIQLSPCLFFQFSGLASQKCIWPSTTKMSCPSCLYMFSSRVCVPLRSGGIEMLRAQ